MTAQVGAHTVVGGSREPVHSGAEEPGVLRSQRRPGLHHQGVLVRHVTDLAGVLAHPQIRCEVCRADNCLRLEDQRRSCDSCHGTQCLRNGVHLRLVLAVGAHPFEDEGNRVEA